MRLAMKDTPRYSGVPFSEMREGHLYWRLRSDLREADTTQAWIRYGENLYRTGCTEGPRPAATARFMEIPSGTEMVVL